MLQRRGQVHFDGRDVIEDSADLSADKTEENLRQLRADVLRPVEESSGAYRVGGQERPGPVISFLEKQKEKMEVIMQMIVLKY